MRRVLAISSWVGAGHVGLSAATPVMQAMGCEVLQLPTVMLSNHYGWPHAAGERVAPERLRDMLAAMAGNGWLEGVNAVLTGYLPTAAHVDFAVEAVGAVKGAQVIVDPVMGDDPDGLYIDPAAAEAIKTRLAPLADILTPNRFELGFLTGRPGEDVREVAEPGVLVTSVPQGTGRTGVWDASMGRLYATPRYKGVPKGVGDAFAALIAAGSGTGAALGRLEALIQLSRNADHLRIAAPGWRNAAPIAPD